MGFREAECKPPDNVGYGGRDVSEASIVDNETKEHVTLVSGRLTNLWKSLSA